VGTFSDKPGKIRGAFGSDPGDLPPDLPGSIEPNPKKPPGNPIYL